MYQRMSRCSSLDFSKSYKITTPEVPIAMFKFPQWRIRGSGMEDIADCGSLVKPYLNDLCAVGQTFVESVHV